jgi:hypothetical protein
MEDTREVSLLREILQELQERSGEHRDEHDRDREFRKQVIELLNDILAALTEQEQPATTFSVTQLS